MKCSAALHSRKVLAVWLLAVGMMIAVATAQTPRIGGEARLEAWQLHQEMADSSSFKDLQWQTLGPKFAGGRIESIDAPRDDLGTIYVGVGAGGIWKTINGGLSWQPIFAQQSTFAIGDLTVAPSDPNTIWVGTGETHLSRTSYAGTGVFKSVDGGSTWSNMGLHESAQIGKIVIDPADRDTVYVAAMGRKGTGGQRGIYKTTDGGKSFRRVLFVAGRVAFVDLVMDPFDPACLIAAAWDRGGRKDSGLFRSVDHGEHWSRLAGGLLRQDVGRVAVDMAPSKRGVVYTLMVDHSPPGEGRYDVGGVVFRSDDRGDTWRRTHEKYVPTYVGWDFCDVRVAPDNADQVYICGFKLLITHDGGKTFQRGGEDVYRLHAHRGKGMHLDMHDIWIDPQHPERVLLGNDGGLYTSWDRGRTWLHLNNLPIAEFYHVYVDDQQPFQIWGGTQDNAAFVGPSTARDVPGADDTWQQVFLDPWAGGDAFATFPDPHDPEIVYYTQQNGDLKRSRRGRLKAEKSIRPHVGRDQPPLRWAWDAPFMASQHGTTTTLYCAAQRVYRSTDRGDSWQAISPDLTKNGLLALAESPLDPQRLIAGGGRGEVHLTADGGKTWTKVGTGLPGKTIRDISASVHDEQRIYVALSGKSDNDSASYLFASDDFGKSWRSIAANLPHESVNAIVEDPATPGLLFAGTDLGVYVSTDAGAGWQSLCHTLPTASVVDLAVQGRDGALVAATHGLSMFLLDIKPIRKTMQ